MDKFLEQRKNAWQRLEDLLRLLDTGSLRKLNREEVRELAFELPTESTSGASPPTRKIRYWTNVIRMPSGTNSTPMLRNKRG